MIEKTLKIGILGGTFNPIHNAHIKIAQYAIDSLGLDYVLIMPSGVSYLKSGTGVLDSKTRAEMTRLALINQEKLKLDLREVHRDGNSYTSDTVVELTNEYKNAEFYYIIGADTLFSMEKWYKPEVIFNNCIIFATVRDDMDKLALSEKADYLKNKFNAKIIMSDMGKIEISSTKIRNMIKDGEDIHSYVPFETAEYIIQNGLYKL